jgi:excisionase family DNA binding protein
MSLWRVDQAADYLGIRPKTLYEWVRTGRVPHRKLGFNVRFEPEELASWVGEQQSSEPGSADSELEAAALAAAQQLRRVEMDLGAELSFSQRRVLRDLAVRLERAVAEA